MKGLFLLAFDEGRPPYVVGGVIVTRGFASRARGLLLREGAGEAGLDVLAIPRCCDVHTFGMRRSIDVAFVDRRGFVLHSERAVLPCRRRRVKGASCVLERFAADRPWVSEGALLQVVSREAACEVLGQGNRCEQAA